MARVNINVTARDLTRGELARMRRNFANMGSDLDRMIGERTRQNFLQLRESVNRASASLRAMRGAIPDDEFVRLNAQLRASQRTLQRGFGDVGDRAMRTLIGRLREVDERFRDLSDSAQIRVRVDTSALRRADAQLERFRREQGRMRIRANVEAPSSGRLRRIFTMPFRTIGATISGILSDGVGQGIIGGLSAAGPVAGTVLGTALVAAVIAALSLAGAAIAGALIFAIGGAFVGLASISAAQSDEVQRNWKAAAKSIGEDLKQAGEPLIPVLHRAVHILEGMSKEFAPHFREAMESAVPTLNGFIDRTRDGFRKMGQHAWDDLQEAFRVFVTAFGPEWEDFLAEFGKSLGALARTVSEHSTEMAMALRAVLGIINFLVDAVNFLANAWVLGIRFMNDSIASLMDGFGFMLDGFLGMIDGMLGGLESVAGMLGMEDEVALARESFNSMRESAVKQFTDIADNARYLNDALDYTNRTRKLEVDIDAWTSRLNIAKQELKDVPPEKRSALIAEIGQLERQIASATGQLNGMRKDYYVRIHAYKVGDWAIGGGGPQAHGGVTGNWGRAATGGARSNMTLVGEHGPELVNLPPGSHVRSNPDSRRMMGMDAPAGGGGGSTLLLKSSGRRVDDLLIEILREAIHQRGGDPVTVLGGR
jgi:hypothetical protein